MVEAVTPISPTVSSSPTQIHTSTSIGSEPDNAWVAARQSVITAGLLKLKRTSEKEQSSDGDPNEEAEPSEEPHRISETLEHAKFSGESERIGTTNFDEDTPFGERTAIV